MKRAEQRILVLQGGGALGAYEAGVYEALTAAAHEPQWLAGVSIGAIDAALIAGNPPERRAERLRKFLMSVGANLLAGPCIDDPRMRQWFNRISAALTALVGLPGFYSPHGWVLNLRTRRLTAPAGISVELSNGEFSLLTALRGAPRRVLPREQLLSMSRLHEAEVDDRTNDVQILRLRRKVEPDPSRPTLIITQRGAGFPGRATGAERPRGE